MTHEIMIADECHKPHNKQEHTYIKKKSRGVAENYNDTVVNDKTVVIDDTMLLILRKKRRAFYHHTCLLSVMAAFTIGLAMGVFFLPLIGLTSAKSSTIDDNSIAMKSQTKLHKYDFKVQQHKNYINSVNLFHDDISEVKKDFTSKNNPSLYSSISFISDEKYSTENILNDDINNAIDMTEDVDKRHDDKELEHNDSLYEKENNEIFQRIVENDIYWGQDIENRIPNGFSKRDNEDWQSYLQSNITEIIKIEQGCGRMQNRLVTFSDGVKACVRYRQNTDQIQGELFSFFLGHLLNISNLVPSSASVIDWDLRLWTQVKQHITESQWKTSRPVVFTKWIPDLEPSGIPKQFRPHERHMNKNDIWNITLNDDDDMTTMKPSQILIERLKAKYEGNKNKDESNRKKFRHDKKIILNDRMYNKFVELAQWSDLIIFDYLIANLDRVVNNLYNFQWNADIMAAPAHNLAKQINSQLLVFLDNESGLLHGYRLLKKYEAYHSLLLDDLCIFRRSTIDALQYLHKNNAGELLNQLFDLTTSSRVRDVLPPLPEKSIKILSDRIDHVLQQVQKCQDSYSNT